jgi:hypothetical protein
MPTLMDLVSWFLLCILAVFTLGGFYIDHATKYPAEPEKMKRPCPRCQATLHPRTPCTVCNWPLTPHNTKDKELSQQ